MCVLLDKHIKGYHRTYGFCVENISIQLNILFHKNKAPCSG